MAQEPEIAAVRDEVTAHVLRGNEGIDEALAMLDEAEARGGVPLVDEGERQRMTRLASGEASRDAAWWSLLARGGERPVGYGALVLAEDGPSTGDAAVDRAAERAESTLRALLAGLRAIAADRGAPALQVWLRQAGEPDLETAAREGFAVHRRLGVLGRRLDVPLPEVPSPAGRIRAFSPGADDAEVARVLAAAYAGTDEAGWDLERLRERTALPWFRPQDLLVAEAPAGSGADAKGAAGSGGPDASQAGGGRLAGLHWLKRRDATVGEVYNLAIDPAVQGTGLGPALLRAGLEHLRDVGCEDVWLWVDLDNDRAVRLYTDHGFTTRWLDVALVATT